jgi:hypothetical protein
MSGGTKSGTIRRIASVLFVGVLSCSGNGTASTGEGELVIAVDGNLWLPLFDGGEVVQAAVPASTVGGPSG